jgi:alkylation response protein AidB-like acyl-CoA dehydrogenase
MFEVPESVRPIRDQVRQFIEERIYPVEHILNERNDPEGHEILLGLQREAKKQGLWALGHPREIGGKGLPFMDYVYVNEVVGRSEHAMIALGTHSLQDSIMLNLHASPEWRHKYLAPLVAGEIFPSFGMTEPDVAGSDPTQIQTRGVLDGDEWVINGRKWFTTGAAAAAYTTVMCRTESDDTPAHSAFSMIIVPTNTPGYNIIRDTPVMGMHDGHYEVDYDNVRVPRANLLGEQGKADKQQIQVMVFETAAEIQACRLLTLNAAEKMDRGDPARVEIGLIKVVGAAMLHNAIDRAIQVFGAKGVTSDTPLERMYRTARFGRIYDGPDEVHRQTVARLILREYARGRGWDFGTR